MIHSKPELLAMVLDKCDGTDPALACAIVHSLSQWQPNMKNVQGREDSESTWGLFQFTGQQARQTGYKGELLQLLGPELNISLGIDLMKNALVTANNRAENALLLYLGRSRAMMIPAILSLVEPYRVLIEARPEQNEKHDSRTDAAVLLPN